MQNLKQGNDMYTHKYNVTATNEKITAFNRAQMVRDWFVEPAPRTVAPVVYRAQMVRDWFVEQYPHQFTRDDKKQFAWLAKWAVIGFFVASVARYFINQL